MSTLQCHRSAVSRPGDRVTIVALANMVTPALAAAGGGLVSPPSDRRAAFAARHRHITAPSKTGRLMSSTKPSSRRYQREIVARLQQEAFYYLMSDHPRQRASRRSAGPTLEKEFLPGKERIFEAARKAIG
jgi:pyruvate/2-oxoglutarate/acetoin dehydrogenase E1 component